MYVYCRKQYINMETVTNAVFPRAGGDRISLLHKTKRTFSDSVLATPVFYYNSTKCSPYIQVEQEHDKQTVDSQSVAASVTIRPEPA